jgi:Cdc6-like AAA superfamily ATPase
MLKSLHIRGKGMENIIFIEGVSGVGKSTTVQDLSEKLRNLGYSVTYHLEGDSVSPLDLCWAAYLTIPEYERLVITYPIFAEELSKNIIFKGDYILLRYQIGRTGLYSQELNNELHKREFCYNPINVAPLNKFTQVFLELWQSFANSKAYKWDYMIFDASLVSHMTNDLIRNYNASENEMVKHLETLLQTISHLNPIVYYLSSENVSERLIKARQNRGQTPPTKEQIKFWERRKQIDLPILSRLSVEAHIMDISNENWSSVTSQIVARIIKREKE